MAVSFFLPAISVCNSLSSVSEGMVEVVAISPHRTELEMVGAPTGHY